MNLDLETNPSPTKTNGRASSPSFAGEDTFDN